MAAPLQNIRVVEVANWLAAPGAAALMADMGASVIKVEPPGGDSYRHSGGRDSSRPNYVFETDNRGKKSITVDLSKPGAKDVLDRLIESADIFITNLVQNRRVQYGLTVAEVRKLNPKIIYASFSGYGTEGPDADKVGFDFTAFWARSGIMALLGEPDSAPVPCRPGQGDHVTALNILASVLAALRLRDLTGEGQVVDVTLVGTGVWTIASDISTALATRKQPARHNTNVPSNPTRNCYRCSDGQWIMLSMNQQNYWAPFCRLIGRPEWEEDARFATLQARMQNSAALTLGLQEVFAADDSRSWWRRLEAGKMIWAPVAELPDVVEDQTLRGLGSFAKVEHPILGTFETLSAPFRIEGADIAVRGPAPSPGEHTESVLADLGFDSDEVAAMAVAGVFG